MSAFKLVNAYPDAEFTWFDGDPLSDVTWITAKPGTDAEIQAVLDAEPTEEQWRAARAARTSSTDDVANILEDLLGLLTLLPGAGDAVQAKIDTLKNRDDLDTLKAEALLL